MRSFASDLRRDIAASPPSSREERITLLAGLLDAAGALEGDTLRLSLPGSPLARMAITLLHACFGLDPTFRPPRANAFAPARYTVETTGNRAVQAAEEIRHASTTLKSPALKSSYLRGAFAAAGSVTRPGRELHLEFVHREEAFVRRVVALCRARLRVTRRRNRWVAYTKSADGVTTLLSQIGLHDAVLEYEARSIIGEAKANANRVTNFDSANASRTAASAARQKAALEQLDPDGLPPALRQMRELRLKHDHATLSELARLGGISRSAANHRLRRLLEMAGRGYE